MHYETLETEKYYLNATRKKINAINNRKARHSLQTFLLGVMAIGLVAFIAQQFPNWIPSIASFVESQVSNWL